MRGKRKLCESNTYHVICRGVGRHVIFEDSSDRQRFIDLVKEHSRGEGVTVYAWCLMDNHAHLLLRASMDAIANMMRKVNSTYAVHYNKRHDHVGHLFQGRFKSEPVDDDPYFLTVLRYIHKNPEKAGISQAAHYPWSSYAEYVGRGCSRNVCDTSLALGMLGSAGEFEAFHSESDGPLACMEHDGGARTLDEDRVKDVAIQAIGEEALRKLGSLPKVERDRLIAELKGTGLSIRKIERLTGVGRKIIASAKR